MAAPSGSRPELSSGSSVSSLRRESVEVARPPDAISGLGSVSATDALEFLDQVSCSVANCMHVDHTVVSHSILSVAGCCQQNQSRTYLEAKTQIQFIIREH